MISQERLLILCVVFTMALGLSLTLHAAVLVWYGIALALLACAAVPYVLHTHPSYSFSPLRLVIPAGIALAAPSIARLLANNSLVVAGVFGPGTLLYATIYSEYVVIRPSAAPRVRLARLALTLTCYTVALSFFVLVYQVKERSLVSGSVVAIVTGLLALRLFTIDRGPDQKSELYAVVTALAMAEILWPLNYWVLSAAVGGTVLLLAYYVLVGLLRQLLTAALNQRLVLEYLTVAMAGLAIIAVAGRL